MTTIKVGGIYTVKPGHGVKCGVFEACARSHNKLTIKITNINSSHGLQYEILSNGKKVNQCHRCFTVEDLIPVTNRNSKGQFVSTAKKENPQPKEARLVAENNTECVPVPVAWLTELLRVENQSSVHISSEMTHLTGYIKSAKAFLKGENV